LVKLYYLVLKRGLQIKYRVGGWDEGKGVKTRESIKKFTPAQVRGITQYHPLQWSFNPLRDFPSRGMMLY
jgi:hypothetical protein